MEIIMQSRLQLDSANPAFRVQLLCLLAAGVLEYLFIVGMTLFDWYFFFSAETYLIIPALLFLGTALTRELSPQAKRQLLLCTAMVLWFIVTETVHRANDMPTRSFGLFLAVYLLPFPFAAVTQDGAAQKGLTLICRVFIAAGLTLVVYTALLMLDLLPAPLASYVKWDGARLSIILHPNLCGSLFMIGIALCLGFFFRAERKGQKLLLLLAAAAQFLCMSLTHSRTPTILTCCLVGAAAFFAIWRRNGWKRFAAGAAAALVLVCTLFLTSDAVFQRNNDRLIAQASRQIQESSADTAAPIRVNAAGELQGGSGQGTLKNDLRTFNARTHIWSAVFQALQETPSILRWGIEPVSPTLSYYYGGFLEHTHNSWLETLFRLGIPGLIIALIFTLTAVWDAVSLLFRNEDMGKNCIALLVLCLLANGILEPYLFCEILLNHFFDFLLFLLMGYMTQWRKAPGSDVANP